MSRPISPRGARGDRPPSFGFAGGGRGFWAEERGPKGPHMRGVFRARGLYTIKERLADFGRSAKRLKRLSFCWIFRWWRSLVSPLSVARIPPFGRSYPPFRSLVSPLSVAQTTCLSPPPSWRPARDQMFLLTLARHGPDMHQVVPDLKRLDRASGFEIPERLGQILLKML